MKQIQKDDLITIIHDGASHIYRVIDVEPDVGNPYTTTVKLIRLTRTVKENNAKV